MHIFRETTLFTYAMATVSIVAFMFALEMKSTILVYLAIGAVGFVSGKYWILEFKKNVYFRLFTNAYMPVGFEFAMELTFPSSEGTTTGLLMAPSQILGVVFALMLGQLNALIGPFWALGSQAGLLGVGTVITWFVPNKLKKTRSVQ